MSDWTELLQAAAAVFAKTADERQYDAAVAPSQAWATHHETLARQYALAARVLRRLADDDALLRIEHAAQLHNLRDDVPWLDSFRAGLCEEEAHHAD